ncbi:pentapeptide repeat-containing protein [Papillibacter cinnamivorans]|uniref:Pentapeptide repeat-containing protein n=1 Tax=Papillibacter cinnamivorans DSM 12816 TaxID=1122930 RepID=A0A1W2CDD5_9FIRM|nr:pentapeptide repeat-containing protein [Papillibacter cinnamivorans]SMC82678.1 Pentapeptide repeat-containing protein [Papillibacter cinnamivorans DSM 12816]
MKIHENSINDAVFKPLRIDCSHCSGLCCTALFFSKTDGFPKDKIAGKSCTNMRKDFSCKIHKNLMSKKMKGCIGYDCFGAGQAVTTSIYMGDTWLSLPEKAQQIFDVFLIVFHLHQMRWFLTESKTITLAKDLWSRIDQLIEQNINICAGPPEIILEFDLNNYKDQVNDVLRRVGTLVKSNFTCQAFNRHSDYWGKDFSRKNLEGADLSMTLLMEANFSGCSFLGTNLLGADIRNSNFEDADLREAIFLHKCR